MPVVYLGLGANLGDRAANLDAALAALTAAGVHFEAVSPRYETDPVGYLDQPPFLNAVARATTDLSPAALLATAKGIEAALGRQASFRNAPRPVDIDILLYGDVVSDDPVVTLPHPRLADRAFVLVPFADLAPDVLLPNGRRIGDLAAAIDRSGVRPVC